MPTSQPPFETVFIAGGTHGNERTGVALVRHWQQNPAEVTREGFATRLFLANPEAVRANRRFIDCDLNRSFLTVDRAAPGEAPYEVRRAREIAAWMRSPKPGKRSFAIDLHTSTACMGITLITSSDPTNLAVAAAVQDTLPEAKIYCFADGERINSCLRAAAQGGLGIEIGPIPQGVVRHDTLDTTGTVVRQVLDAVQAFNQNALPAPDGRRPIYRHARHVAYPETTPGAPPAFIHRELQGRDYAPLKYGQPIFQDLGGRTWTFDEPETRYPVFINEAAYYREDIAFSLTQRVSLAAMVGF
jgi:aspartoacylase